MALSDMIPPAATDEFLTAAGWGGARVEPLAGDASFRRYFRVIDGARVAVLMDAPPPHEDPRPFIHVAEHLRGLGLAAPAIHYLDLKQGLLLIEDFGSDRMREALDVAPIREAELYNGAVRVLTELHRHAPASGLPVHALETWLSELTLFTDWYGPASGLNLDADSFLAAWRAVLEPVDSDGLPRVTMLRDFHAENVMLLPGRTGVAAFGLLDFQDACVGHPAYDLASILEDARRDVTPAIERAMIDAYVAANARDARFEAAYWALAAQRNSRILGVFCRLWRRDGKPHYRSFQSRMWGLLERDLAQPPLAPVRNWFDTNVPADKRAPLWAEFAV